MPLRADDSADSLNRSDDEDERLADTGLLRAFAPDLWQDVHAPLPANPPDEIAPGVVAAGNNFKVVVRVRPPLPRELSGDKRFQNIARIDRDRTITLCENLVRPASGSCVTL